MRIAVVGAGGTDGYFGGQRLELESMKGEVVRDARARLLDAAQICHLRSAAALR
jgi:hypothetical protein